MCGSDVESCGRSVSIGSSGARGSDLLARKADAWLQGERLLGNNMRIVLFAAIWFAVGLLSVFVLAGVLEAMALRH